MPSYLKPDVLARAESLGLKARQLVEGLRVGDHKSPYKGFSVEFVQHREYVPGDDIRHIDWKSYGRSERYTIKQYEQETNYIAHLIVDCSNSMRYGAGETNKLEYAKLIAASLSYLIVRQRDSVALRVFNDKWAAELPPSSQLGHIHTITHTLEETQPKEKTRIGPLLDEVEFPLDGNDRFIGLEGAEELMTRPHLLRPAYLRVVQKYLGAIQRGCDGSGVDYVRMMTNRPLVAGLGEYLVRRLQTGKR